jgi:hypothetical protein
MANNTETSITRTKRVDIDALMSDDFSVDNWLGASNASNYNLAAGVIGKEEMDSKFKMSAFLDSVGVSNENMQAHTTAARVLSGSDKYQGTWEAVKEGWKNNKAQLAIADIRVAEMMGQLPPDQAQKQVDYYKSLIKEGKTKGLSSWLKAAAGQSPMMLDTSYEGVKTGLVGAGMGAVGAAVAGQAGPQVLLPEEAVTVPVTAAGGFAFGFPWGAVRRAGEIEAGLMYDELVSFKDAQGNKIDPAIAKPIAATVGVVNGLLELAQVKDVISTIPGGRKLLAKAQRDAISNLAKNKSLLKVLGKSAARYGGNIAFETAVEIQQEASNVVFGELAKSVSNQLDGTSLDAASKKEIVDRLTETAKEAAKAFTLISGPGNVIQTTTDTVAAISPVEGQTKPDSPVGRVGKIVPRNELIRPRIDVSQLGQASVEPRPKVKVEKEAPPLELSMPAKRLYLKMTLADSVQGRETEELPGDPKAAAELVEAGYAVYTAKNKIKLQVKGDQAQEDEIIESLSNDNKLTPEEEYALQQSESTLKAEEPFTIKPKLYIGNVTKRMKTDMAEALDTDPESISGFFDGAFPTKRTQIELATGEARALLIHMENNLQQRVDNNQLNTDSDLAHAHADHGDIQALREALGLPKIPEPFRVIRSPKSKTIVIEKLSDRINKSVQPSKLDKVDSTQIDQLNVVMRRIAKASKEGWAGGKKEAREAYALLQYFRKQRELRAKLIGKISRDVPDSIDFFYREAIKGLQQGIDFKTDTKGKASEKNKLKQLLDANPEKATEIPQEIIDTLGQKSVMDLGYGDLLKINSEIERLRKLGRLKSQLFKKNREKYLKTETEAFVQGINSAKGNILPSAERANTLKPSRLFDMMDGGKDFAGRIFNFFYGMVNENYNVELQNTDSRQQAMKQKLAELGLTLGGFIKKRVIGDIELTVDQMMGIYAGWKNPESQMAIRFGGIPTTVKGQTIYTEVTDQIYNDIVESLTDNEKVWADTIIQEYAENYERLRNSVIMAENRDPGSAVNYTKIKRLNREYTSLEEEVLAELESRGFFKTVGLHKGMTIKRKDIPAEYQSPIDLSLTKVWEGEVRKQEHYINNAVHLKDMKSISKNDAFRESLRAKFGDSAVKFIDNYINRIANPDFYKTYSDLETVSKQLRRHAAIAYIALNLKSVLNQTTSSVFYWAHSSVGDMLKASIEAVVSPRKAFELAKERHYQISHVTIEREMEELRRADENAYKRILSKVGRVGMFGIFAVDRVVRVVGINAVYNYNIRKGMSEKEASDKAAMATLLTQEAASPKDLAQIYSSSEFLNWFTMFTNQLNQIYNISTYDIPAAWKNGHYQDAARSAIALATAASLIWMIQNGELPDEPEDFGDIVTENSLAAIPVVGSAIVAGTAGWTSQPAFLTAANKVGKAAVKGSEGEWEEFIKLMAEPVAVTTGFPYIGAKKMYDFVEAIQ